MKKELNEFEDVTIAAFLAIHGHVVTPLRNPNGRIIFEVEGNIAPNIEAFYANQSVGIMDYVRMLKSLRSSIFTMKTMGQKKGSK
jgi:hypothetical protein